MMAATAPAGNLAARFAAHLAREALLPEGARVLLAVSGGADSMALLHLLHRRGQPLCVAHLNHQARGKASDADAAFVQQVAAELGVPCVLEQAPVALEAKANKRGFEEHAREVRYAFFARAALAQDCTVAATGHHAGDQAETVLMRLLRGAGIEGLAGIPPVRFLETIRLVRPLLPFRHEELVAWLEQEQLPWREDATNAVPDFARNRIRQELLPQLEQDWNPRLSESLCRMAEIAREEAAFLENSSAATLDVCRSPEGFYVAGFNTAPKALRRRILRMLCREHHFTPEFERVEEALGALQAPPGRDIELGDGLLLHIGREEAVLYRPEAEAIAAPVALPAPGEVQAFGKRFRLKTAPAPAVPAAESSPSRQVFRVEVAARPLRVRPWRFGDSMSPLGLGGRKKVSDLLREMDVPAPLRSERLVVLAGKRIIWLIGGPMDASAALPPDAAEALVIEVEDVPVEDAADTGGGAARTDA